MKFKFLVLVSYSILVTASCKKDVVISNKNEVLLKTKHNNIDPSEYEILIERFNLYSIHEPFQNLGSLTQDKVALAFFEYNDSCKKIFNLGSKGDMTGWSKTIFQIYSSSKP